jgi:hypothetical protein
MDVAPSRADTAECVPVDLSAHADEKGVSEPRRWPTTGGFNVWGNTFPAEGIPVGDEGDIAEIEGIPFRMGSGGRADHLRCRGQLIEVPADAYDWIHVLAAAERRTEDELTVHYADGTQRRQWLRVSDFWPETEQRFGELLAFRPRYLMYPRHSQHNMPPSAWVQRVPVTVPGALAAVELPDNPAMHVFAMTLEPRRTVRA